MLTLLRTLSGGGESPTKLQPHLKTVPSFNDFSSGVAPDADAEYSPHSSVASVNQRTHSLDFPDTLDLPSGVQRAASTPSNIVGGHGDAASKKHHQHAQLRLQGMDAFEYCDLIRSL